MPSRNTTKANGADDRLTPQQCAAVDLLVTGQTLTDTAQVLEVDRATVSGWVNHHPPFIAALNSRRQELFDGNAERLRSLLPKALAVIEKELEGPQPLPAALAVLKSCGLATGLGGPPAPPPWRRPSPSSASARSSALPRLSPRKMWPWPSASGSRTGCSPS